MKKEKGTEKTKINTHKKHKEKHTNNKVKGREIDVEARETEYKKGRKKTWTEQTAKTEK